MVGSICVSGSISFSRQEFGWSAATHMRASIKCTALQDAFNRRPGACPLVHSNRGLQYAKEMCSKLLWRNKLKQSMSRAWKCWDNAPTESFFGTLKQEQDIYQLRSAAALREELFEYIEIFYNRKRLHSTLGYKTPEEVDSQYCSLLSAS